MPINLEFLVQRLGDLFESDRGTQAKRESGGIAALKDAIKQFGPGYGSGMEAKAKASATAGAIGSGLGGTTRPAAISAGLSGEFEDMRRGRMATAQTNLANFLGSYRDPTAVTPGTLTHAATGGFGGMLQQQQFDEQRRQVEQAKRDAEPSLQDWMDKTFGTFGGGGSTGTGGSVDDSVWNNSTLGSSGGGGGISSGGISSGGSQTTGNLLGDFDPKAANLRLGNVLQGDAGLGDGNLMEQFGQGPGLQAGEFDSGGKSDTKEPGMVGAVYGGYTYAPTSASESMAWHRWSKANPEGTMKQWRLSV